MAAITAELVLEIHRLKAGLDQARQEIRGFRSVAQKEGDGIGAALFGNVKQQLAGFASVAGVAGVAAGVKQILGHYDDLADTALKLNESTEVVQRVGQAAELSGSSVDGLANAALKLEKALGEAGNEKAAKALEHYGVTAEHLSSLPLDQKLLVVSEAFQRARAEGTGYNDLLALMGRSAGELIPLLSQSREELQALFDGAAVVDDATVQQLAAMNDELDRLGQKLTALAAGPIRDVARGTGVWMDWLGRNMEGISNFVSTGDTSGLNQFKNFDDAQAAKAGEEYEQAVAAKRRSGDRALARRTQAEALGAQAAEREGKATGRSGDELDKLRRDALPDGARLDALKSAVQDIYRQAGVSGEGGLQDRAYNLKNYGGSAADLEKSVALLKQVRELNKEIASIEEKKKSQAEQSAKQLDDLRAVADQGGIKLLTRDQQAAALRDKLSKSFGFEVRGGEDVAAGLSKLRQEADAARSSGDAAAEKKKLEELKVAQEQAAQLSGLAPQQKGTSVVGETAGVLNVLFGRSGSSDLVLDENKQQTSVLRDIQRVLERIEKRDDSASGDDFGFEL